MSRFNMSDWTSGIRGRVLLGLVVVLILTGFVVHKREKSRPPRPDVAPVNAEIQAIESEISVIQGMRPLLPLPVYWREALSAAPVLGVQLQEIQAQTNPDGSPASYTGPLKHWDGAIQGEFPAVIAYIREMQARVPMFVFTIQKDGTKGAAVISFVGTEG